MIETRMIEIKTGKGKFNVRATVYGQLAVHECLDKAGLYVITHIGTGKALRTHICEETVHDHAIALETFDWDAYVAAGMPAPNKWFGERFSELRGIFIDIDNAVDCD